MNLDNLKDLLHFLNFTQQNEVFTKKFILGDYTLAIDFENKQIQYPESFGLIINERQTCNFSSNENFVVFECVHRLLEKGYKPEHIELEPKWKLGHGASGGRADILVKNYQNEPFLIIECKTFDKEFNKAWKDTLEDGGQLFSYVEQEKSVEFVCLYASQWSEKEQKIDDQQRIISVKDNPIILKDLPDALHYSNAKNVRERFKVWKETYQLEATEKGIFEDNILAYQIGKDKYTLAIDTQPINSMNIKGKYHEFRTILRKHNVSRRENAFEVLVNLFLCKIVDETQNPEDLHFYWKGMAYDSYFDLVDRLQKLYKIGMDQFLQQDIVYVSQDDIDKAFWAIKQKPNATEQRIKELFKQLKFYKGLDFEFIKVSNKEKFEKNAKILIEIIQMWQGLRLTSTEENQFLGDMFEYFLDNGIKQSEGQFFTPIPICKFIVSALPLETMLQKHSEPLKVIDYACGSGHFLNEYGSQVSKLLKPIKDIDEPNGYYAQTYGIEKEDRLAKVSKVASFMYGRNEVNIIDADALVSHEDIKPESFDILVANPPFAVEDFLQTIGEVEREKFKLFNLVNNPSNNNIQCFFLERAQQLLAPDSVMGVIVPSSILSNGDTIHIATREILLQYFDFLSIVELGSQTFGKTGTNTVILFLRRKAERPEQAVQFKNRVNNFFQDWETEKASAGGAYLDIKVVEKYCQHIDVNYDVYQSLLMGNLIDDLLEIEIFKDYQADFYKQTEIVNLQKQKQFKAKNKEHQQAELDKRLLSYLIAIEKDKLYYFMLTQYNALVENKARPLLVVKSPSDNKEQKKFLGYEWSSAKGNEGLSYLGGETIFEIHTPLFDPKNRDNSEKISYLIRQNFNGEQITLYEALTPFVSQVYLHDVLDFSRKEFNKAFNLSAQSRVEIQSQWNLVKLGDVCHVLIGGTPSRAVHKYFNGENLWVSISEMQGNTIFNTKEKITDEAIQNSNVKLIPKGTTLLSFKLSIGKTAIAGKDLYTNEAIAGLVPKNENVIDTFLFHLFSAQLLNLDTGNNAIGKSLNSKFLREELKIPLPPLDIQQKIVEECEMVDLLAEDSANNIQSYKSQLELLFSQSDRNVQKIKLKEALSLKAGKFIKASEIQDQFEECLYPCYGGNNLRGYVENYNQEGDYCLVGRQGALCGNVTFAQGKFYATEHALVVTPLIPIYPKWLFYYLIELNLNQYATGVAQPGLSVSNLDSILLNIPSLEEQEKIVQQIEILETQIAQAQKIIDAAPQQKQAILQKYL
ncbi:restriction endonuclease subunit S [Acinetobacter modestus]|uniref:restriction endonuclease subunit S n=1 Tax=Acinetobacter modestus TaxID=1776740 RepID=UPI001F4BC217|nr:restriction endonuclease subunit S [Acinetobacter modestus]MCH7386813.1 restriction endonuclease subunit S [Acinetobacter modestus]